MVAHVNALLEGFELQEYAIQGTLGFGSFGITYIAKDRNLNKMVAIKEYFPTDWAVRGDGSTLEPNSIQSKDSLDWGLNKFLEEARTIARFNHPNIVKIHRFFRLNETGYIVMELVSGSSLEDLLEEHGTLSETQIKDYLWPVMDGLIGIHDAGFLHRDIKPHNIMIRDDGSPVLIDFGAARSSVSNRTVLTRIYTPGYGPVEQSSDQQGMQGPWTDIYALAAVMYRCVTGDKPVDAISRTIRDDLVPVFDKAEGKYSRIFLESIDIGLGVRPEHRPQTIADWFDMFEGNFKTQILTKNPGTPAAGDLTKLDTPTVNIHDELESAEKPGLVNPETGLSETASDRYQKTRPYVLGLFKQMSEKQFAILAAGSGVIVIGLGILVWLLQGDPIEPVSVEPQAETAAATETPPDPVTTVPTPSPEIASSVRPEPSFDTVLSEPLPQPPTTVTLQISTQPQGALVRLSETGELITPDTLVEPGVHEVEISAPGYASRSHVLQISETNRIFSFSLQEPEYELTVVPFPADARVRILNIPDVYQAGIPLPTGEYQIEVSAPHYATVYQTINVIDAPVSTEIALPRSEYRVWLTGAEDASVRIEGREEEYVQGMYLPPGRYNAVVSMPEHVPQRFSLDVVNKDVRFRLQMVAAIDLIVGKWSCTGTYSIRRAMLPKRTLDYRTNYKFEATPEGNRFEYVRQHTERSTLTGSGSISFSDDINHMNLIYDDDSPLASETFTLDGITEGTPSLVFRKFEPADQKNKLARTIVDQQSTCEMHP
jgi:serine/threonine protein kinase